MLWNTCDQFGSIAMHKIVECWENQESSVCKLFGGKESTKVATAVLWPWKWTQLGVEVCISASYKHYSSFESQ